MVWFPKDIIKRTLDETTRNYKVTALPYFNHFKSRNTQRNKRRLHENYANDNLFSSEPSINGETCVQLLVGFTSFLVFAFGIKKES